VRRSTRVAVVTGLLAASTWCAAGAKPGVAAGQASASAWVVRASILSGAHVAGVAEARSAAGPAPYAWSAPIDADGTRPAQASASPSRPSSAAGELTWNDPTATVTVDGGYAAASLDGGGASARAGVGSGAGSSFSMASRLLTWQQQQALTAEAAAINDAVFVPVNARLQALAPVLGILGIAAPHFQEMTPLALINVGGGALAASRTTTVSSAGLLSAGAESEVASVQLLDGFVQLDHVRSTAGEDTARSSFGAVRIAGVPVVVDQGGITVADNSLLARALLQPVLDLVISTLGQHGITLRFGVATSTGSAREATALELDVETPVGLDQVSVAHAAAAWGAPAGASSPTQPAGTPATAPGSPPEAPPPAGTGGAPASATAPSPGNPAVQPAPGGLTPRAAPSPAGRPRIPAWLGFALPANVARALRSLFLFLPLAGLAATLVPVLILGHTRRRSATVPTRLEVTP
jgi:hypothetical protein